MCQIRKRNFFFQLFNYVAYVTYLSFYVSLDLSRHCIVNIQMNRNISGGGLGAWLGLYTNDELFSQYRKLRAGECRPTEDVFTNKDKTGGRPQQGK